MYIGIQPADTSPDDSGSMSFEENGERIKDLKMILDRVAHATALFDDDGIQIRFMNDPNENYNGIKDGRQVEQLVDNHRYSGLTPLGTELRKKVIDKILVPGLRSNMRKPLLIITITDGQPAGENKDTVEQTIQYAVDQAQKAGHPKAVSFMFAQVGNDQKATEFLASLDNNPLFGSHVDCTSSKLLRYIHLHNVTDAF